jgi:hypothetical protein
MTQTLLATFVIFFSENFVVGLVWLVGAILAIVYRKRNPKASRFTLIAIAIFLVEALVSAFTSLSVPLMLRDRGWTNDQLANLYFGLQSIVASLMRAVAWGFILAAIFSRRDEA